MKLLFDINTINKFKSTDKLPCECYYCSKTFFRMKKEITRVLEKRTKSHSNKYCSRNCASKSRDKKIDVSCENCKKTIKRIKKDKGKYYCSKSCAAILNNKIYIKRPSDRMCSHINCNDPVVNHETKLCLFHKREREEWMDENLKTKKIKDFKEKYQRNWHSALRNFGRYWFKHLQKLPCANCGYNKHVDICHIKPISEFNGDSTLNEIHSPSNLIQLCKNCHWEFDSGLININDVISKN